MLAYDISNILALIPEATALVKKASVEEDFPANSKDSVCASYLRIGYMTKVAHKEVDSSVRERITKAASLYGVKGQLDVLSKAFDPAIEKSASEIQGELYSEFEFSFNAFPDIEKTASLAEKLADSGFTGDERVDRFSGKAFLNKEAAVMSLVNRFHATGDKEEVFVKIARMINDQVRENDFDSIRKICHTVTQMDKQAGLDVIGFNFYKEALITKQAAVGGMTVTLAGESFPISKLELFGKDRISALLGSTVAEDYTNDLTNNKYMLEALPRDQQMVLKAALKNV